MPPPGARGAALGPARTPNPANHHQKATRDLINPLGSGLWVPRAPYRAAGPGFAVDCWRSVGRFVENSLFEQQTRSGNQLQPVTVHLNSTETRGAVANEFVFGFCSFPGGENSFGKLFVVFGVAAVRPSSFRKRKKPTNKHISSENELYKPKLSPFVVKKWFSPKLSTGKNVL